MKESQKENVERQKVSARVRKIKKERMGKKKENNKNDDSLSLCYLFMYIYLSIYFI